MKYYIGVDLGTSALKLLLVQEDGAILKTVSRAYPVAYPHPGWSEQNPEDWWTAFVSGVRELTADIDPTAVAGIGAGGQMHGLVVLDDADAVIRPAILWNDGRTQKETDYLNQVIGKEKLSEYTANIAFAGFTAPKLLWLKENEPQNFARIRKIMLPKDYINYKLTGVHTTDYSDASGMLLLDVKNKRWSDEMLDICQITQEQLPRLYESYAPVGTLTETVAAELGLSPHTVVIAGAGDTAAAAIGTGTVEDGRCNISLGTSGTVFISSSRFAVDPANALHAFCHASGDYHLMACILSAASCNKWFCEDILGTDDFVAEQAGLTDDHLGRNHVFFLPYLMGERSPINDTAARGTFIGMRMDTRRQDMLLAVLEGVAFAIRDNLEIARGQGISIAGSTLCGGGAKSPLWQKILCNVLNTDITLLQTEQGPGYGAAMLAMVGCGAYADVADCAAALVKARTTLTPDPAIAARYDRQYNQFKEIYPTLKDLFKTLT
ncbi:MAG: xylulokinase [Clostridia bacterium]|nr:xylulokinase [Clostridia bacterium]